ncbi:hypothetical protein CWB41_13480 [Methylovirgula ligni]|nr:hypothetical protein CWB41_13480 [Methylovirgula ligni]
MRSRKASEVYIPAFPGAGGDCVTFAFRDAPPLIICRDEGMKRLDPADGTLLKFAASDSQAADSEAQKNESRTSDAPTL